MRHKNQKPPICIGGSEKLRAMDRPRYMNVPSPAPCHVNVAGVGKQSVWGLRIIARTQLSLWHDCVNPSIPQSGGYGVRPHHWNLFTQIAKDSDSGTLFPRDLLVLLDFRW